MHSIILLAFGTVLVRLASANALLFYVRPGARPLVLGAGITISALGCWRLIANKTEDAPGPERASRAGWLVLAPVIAVAVVAPPALGALMANHRPPVPPRPNGVLAPLPATDPVQIVLGDIVMRSVWDHGRTLRRHRLRTIGFVSRRLATGFVLTRLVITCCAADAEPNSVEVAASTPAPPLDAWVQVTGRFTGMSEADKFVPALTATEVRPVNAPVNPYE